MKTSISLLALMFAALLAATAFPQSGDRPGAAAAPANAESAERDEKTEKMKRLALEMLRDTAREIETLRTPENRISLSADLVGLLWTHNPEEAREMFRVLTNSFTQLFTQYSGQVNAVGFEEEDLWNPAEREKAKAGRRMMKALVVRENLARAAAVQDPLLALDFVVMTSTAVRGGAFTSKLDESDQRTKEIIVELFAARDKETARELGRRLLKDGFDSPVLALLRTIRAEDEKEGAEFALEVFSAASRDLDGLEPAFGVHASLLRYAAETLEEEPHPDRVEMISRDYAASHAAAFGRAVLRAEELDEEMASSFAEAIRPFSESLADRIIKKFEKEDESVSAETKRLQALLEKSRASDAARSAAKTSDGPGEGDDPSIELSTDGDNEKGELSGREELLRKFSDPEAEEISDEAKQALAAQAREAADLAGTPSEKIGILTAAAVGLKRLGDERLADEIVNEALGHVTSNPRNYEDFMNIWILAGGLVEVRPDIAFTRLEDAVFRLNDVVNAAITIAEFIDVDNDFVQDGELLIGAFASGMTAQMSRMLLAGDSAILGLAAADLARTKALAEKFDRAEVRIMAKTLVLGVVLSERSETDLTAKDLLEGN
ncbi:MAG: hypothetical protein J5I65_13610 [Aridibacter famidurans]|nr:hypothetical protein [Aridibacter famidurans]